MSTLTEEILTIEEFLAKYRGLFGSGYWSTVGSFGVGRYFAQPEEADMPKFPHGVACHRASRVFGSFIETNDLGWIAINDTFVRTKPKSSASGPISCIVSFTVFQRVPNLPADLTIPPDLVAEVPLAD